MGWDPNLRLGLGLGLGLDPHLRRVRVLDGVKEGTRPAHARQDGHIPGVALRHHHVSRGADADRAEHRGEQIELGKEAQPESWPWSKVANWAALEAASSSSREAVAGTILVAEPRPGSAALPIAARRALTLPLTLTRLLAFGRAGAAVAAHRSRWRGRRRGTRRSARLG